MTWSWNLKNVNYQKSFEDKGISFKELVKAAESELYTDYSCDLIEYIRLKINREEREAKQAISWSELDLNISKIPEFRDESLRMIECYLGFIPGLKTLCDFELYFRTLLYQNTMKQINREGEFEDFVDQLKRMRNHEFSLAEWYHTKPMSKYQKESYRTYNLQFADKAKELVSSVIGYEPEELYSFYGELILRDLLEKGFDETYLEFMHWLHLAGWMSVFRKAMYEEGIEAANNLPISAVRKVWDRDDDIGSKF